MSDSVKIYLKQYRKTHLTKIKKQQSSWYDRHKTEMKSKYNKIKNTTGFKRMKRNSDLQWRFGISLIDFNKLLKFQKGKCAICLKRPKNDQNLGVDHNHKTNKVRGLLCNSCNLALGCFQDSIKLLTNALKYLKRNSL